MAAPHNGNGWETMISAGTFIAILFGGGWALFQSQLGSLNEQIKAVKEQAYKDNEILARNREAVGVLFRDRLDKLVNDVAEVRKTVVGEAEFRQWQLRAIDSIEVLRQRTNVLEATRPTTGEIQQAITGIRERLDLQGLAIVKAQKGAEKP